MLTGIFEDLDLCILNTGEMTHFHTPKNSVSILDLSICSPNGLVDFTWRVTDDLRGIDHHPILLTSPEANTSPCVPRWRADRTDWNSFRSLSRVEHNVEEFDEIEGAVTYFTNLLHWHAEHSIPRTLGVLNRRPVPWWSEECRQFVVKRRQTFGRFRRYKTDFYKNKYKRTRARARRDLKEAR